MCEKTANNKKYCLNIYFGKECTELLCILISIEITKIIQFSSTFQLIRKLASVIKGMQQLESESKDVYFKAFVLYFVVEAIMY